MKLNSTLLAISALSAIGGTALAKEISFDFRVHSYGSALYPCDAGVQHINEPGDFLRAHAKRIATPPTGRSGYDSTAPDFNEIFLEARTGANDSMKTVAYRGGQTTIDSVYAKFRTLLQDLPGMDASNTTDPGLHFFLASDHYGAQYFVDLCYAGPRVPYAYPGSLNYNIAGSVTAVQLVNGTTDVTSGSDNYLANSGVKVTGKVVCDSNFASDWATNSISDTFVDGNLLGLAGVGTGTTTSTFLAESTAATVATVYNQTISVGTLFARHCVLRYLFQEQFPTRERSVFDGEHAQFKIQLGLKPVMPTPR